MSARHKKMHKISIAAANRSATVILSLGVVLGSSVASTTAASAAPSTWNPGKNKGFLHWARPGMVQEVKVTNNTKQNIYVLQRTQFMFVLADMGAAAASLSTGATVAGMGKEALINLSKDAKNWRDNLVNGFITAYNKWEASGKVNVIGFANDARNILGESVASLNGDVSTLRNGYNELYNRIFSDNVHTDLHDKLTFGHSDPYSNELMKRIKDAAITVAPGATESVRKADYTANLDTYLKTLSGGGISFPKGFTEKAAFGLGLLNILGVSTLLGQAGVDTTDMWVVTKDGKKSVNVSTAPNVSWIIQDDRVSPAKANGALERTLGYYEWNRMGGTPTERAVQQAIAVMEKDGISRDDASSFFEYMTNGASGGNLTADQKNERIAEVINNSPDLRQALWLRLHSPNPSDYRRTNESIADAMKWINSMGGPSAYLRTRTDDSKKVYTALQALHNSGIDYETGRKYLSNLWQDFGKASGETIGNVAEIAAGSALNMLLTMHDANAGDAAMTIKAIHKLAAVPSYGGKIFPKTWTGSSGLSLAITRFRVSGEEDFITSLGLGPASSASATQQAVNVLKASGFSEDQAINLLKTYAEENMAGVSKNVTREQAAAKYFIDNPQAREALWLLMKDGTSANDAIQKLFKIDAEGNKNPEQYVIEHASEEDKHAY